MLESGGWGARGSFGPAWRPGWRGAGRGLIEAEGNDGQETLPGIGLERRWPRHARELTAPAALVVATARRPSLPGAGGPCVLIRRGHGMMDRLEVSAQARDRVLRDLRRVPREPGGSGWARASDFSRGLCREEQRATTSAKLLARVQNYPESCRVVRKFRRAVLIDSWVFYPRKLWSASGATPWGRPNTHRTRAAGPVTGPGFQGFRNPDLLKIS